MRLLARRNVAALLLWAMLQFGTAWNPWWLVVLTKFHVYGFLPATLWLACGLGRRRKNGSLFRTLTGLFCVTRPPSSFGPLRSGDRFDVERIPMMRSEAEAKFLSVSPRRRHVGLVHGIALRRIGGDAHMAQDIVQTVFTDLAGWTPPTAVRATRSIAPSAQIRTVA